MAASMLLALPALASVRCPGRTKPGLIRAKPSKPTSIRSSITAEERKPLQLDRRNLLLGLGGIYGAGTLAGTGSAFADPVEAPDLTACHTATYPDAYGDEDPVYCCPPYTTSETSSISEYEFPTFTTLRTRRPAHCLTQWEIDRFESAITAMKALSTSDPWSFTQQARIHCAFCNGAYYQTGYDDVLLQIHYSWLFLPWHRYYVYFFERILGKIIDDDTFALPFWNYDVREGMYIPDIYLDTSSSLYDSNRNSSHLTEEIDLSYALSKEETTQDYNVEDNNIAIIRNMLCDYIDTPDSFMGSAIGAGETPSMSTTMGACESVHNIPHMWVGNIEAPNIDMGNFYSAARDMLFWAHHSNVDRFWNIYQTLRNNVAEFTDSDWLDATFVFYDENQEIVTVKVSDCLDPSALGYTYEDVDVEYLPCDSTTVSLITSSDTTVYSTSEFGSDAQTLSDTLNLSVTRPAASAASSDQTEMLVIKDIEMLDPSHARFDIYVNTLNDDGTITGLGSLAGMFSRVRHVITNADGTTCSISRKLAITNLLSALGADTVESIGVSLVPLDGSVQIGSVYIELVDNS